MTVDLATALLWMEHGNVESEREIERLREDLAAICDMLTSEHERNNPDSPTPDWTVMARSLAEAIKAGESDGA